ncbi:MAG: hypothetical protein Q8J62_07800 [Candidatus Cloacimonadaceae bacterium]|nr:hypothetical protein [Candidatus Cloacimonadaceae bacterium]
MIKLFIALMALLIFIVVFCILLLNNILVQLFCFGILALIMILRRGLKHLLKELKLLVSFSISMLAVYLIFGFVGLKTTTGSAGSIPYWLNFSSARILLLLNTVLFIHAVFSLLSYADLLKLNLGIGRTKYLILGKILYDAAFLSHAEILFHQSMIPLEQSAKPGFTHRFTSTLARVLALMYFIISEARLKGEMIDNRILHCHLKEKK